MAENVPNLQSKENQLEDTIKKQAENIDVNFQREVNQLKDVIRHQEECIRRLEAKAFTPKIQIEEGETVPELERKMNQLSDICKEQEKRLEKLKAEIAQKVTGQSINQIQKLAEQTKRLKANVMLLASMFLVVQGVMISIGTTSRMTSQNWRIPIYLSLAYAIPEFVILSFFICKYLRLYKKLDQNCEDQVPRRMETQSNGSGNSTDCPRDVVHLSYCEMP